MITIYTADPELNIPLPENIDLTIGSRSEYIIGYDRIAKAIHAGHSLTLLVTDRKVTRWLEVMSEKYGPNHIQIKNYTAKFILKSKTGLREIPDEVSDEQIQASGLLNLNINASPDISFEDYILEVFFGKFLTADYGLRSVGDIVGSFDKEQWEEALERPLVRKVFNQRIRELRKAYENENDQADLMLLSWFEESPAVFLRNMFAIKVLQDYPQQIGERLFGSAYQKLLDLKLNLRKVPTMMAGNEALISEIRLHIESLLKGKDALSLLISQASGLLEIEYFALQTLIEKGRVVLKDEMLRKIRKKFQSLERNPLIAQSMSGLDLLIPKDPPSQPEANWGCDQWLEWAVHEYLPYRFWLENSGQITDQIGETASIYADWLYKNYGSLLYQSEHMVWRKMLHLKDKIKAFDGPVLIVVIDNFNTKFYPDLRHELQRHGFYEESCQHSLSLIPSCTEVSKKALMTGHYSPFSETGYEKQVETVWENRLEKRVKYLANINELRTISDRKHDVYFLNYLPIDITLHQNENHLGVSHAMNIRSFLHILSQDIRAFALRLGVQQNLMVVFVSDHGSTRIPKGTVNVIQRSYYQDRMEDAHHRYLEISDQEMEKLNDNVKFDCYLLKKDTYDLPKNYLVARKLYRFLPTDDHVYIHGGLTPEETIVPFAVFKPAVITPKPLDLDIVEGSRIYVGTKFDLTLEITNNNNYDCESVFLEFIDPNISAADLVLTDLAQHTRVKKEITARCPRNADPTVRKLSVMLRFRFLGQDWEFIETLPVTIMEPARPKFDLDDL